MINVDNNQTIDYSMYMRNADTTEKATTEKGTTMKKYLTCAETAKLVRKALKRNFPGTKFGVRSSNYAGGASIDIRWDLGPTSDQVKKVSGLYEGATFDGMIDLKTHHDTALMGENGEVEVVSMGADYIFTHRGYGDKVMAQSSRDMAALLGLDGADPEQTLDENKTGARRWDTLRTFTRRILDRQAMPSGYTGLERTAVRCGAIEDFYQVKA